jgi:branched-chain amino acid transport system substrate-binding protein
VTGAVEQPFCTPVEFAGNGKPQHLIVSDLPLQLPRSNLQPLQFTDVIRYTGLARRIERSGADGVFLGGYSVNNGAALLRDLRATLGPRVPIVAPDGFSEFRDIIEEAGADAEGLFASVASLPPSRLPPPGRGFAEAFEKAVGGEVDPYSITTAQAVEVLLDAIAASDGTRGSVTEQLLEVRAQDGILGSFEFDANGDMTSGVVTVYRIEKGKPRVHAVITPPAELVGRR